jgi:Uri superfamily endonuclease
MQPGVYLLLFSGKREEIRIGSLGTLAFAEGYYGYVGSALGPGGLARVARHIRLFHDRNKKPRWHVDYLLLHPDFTLVRTYCLCTSERLECMLAGGIPLPGIPGFGSSDCCCPSHLLYAADDPDTLIREACRTLGIEPVICVISGRAQAGGSGNLL